MDRESRSPTERLHLHGLRFYEAVARSLREDSAWRSRAGDFSYSIVQECRGDAPAVFFLRFEAGDLCEVQSLTCPTDRSADLIASASVETWRSIFTKQTWAMTAFMLGSLTLEGLRPEMRRHLGEFEYLLEAMSTVADQKPVGTTP